MTGGRVRGESGTAAADPAWPTAAVIGGGPAGLMAAEVLATAGVRVVVHEHMPSLGRKLLLAGRSGLNLTHDEPLVALLGRYGEAEPRLRRAIVDFGPKELRRWATGLGEETFVGSSGRVFPTAMRATPLLRAWLARLDGLGVEVRLRERWLGWAPPADGAAHPSPPTGTRTGTAHPSSGNGPRNGDGNGNGPAPGGRTRRRSIFMRSTGSSYASDADVTLLALGGASWPRVGSDGRWVDAVAAAGILVTELRPANCGVRVEWTADFVARFAGAPLKNVAVSLGACRTRGDVTVTTTGLESGPIYTVAGMLRDALARSDCAAMYVDLHPDLDTPAVEARLARRRPKDSLTTTLRRTLGLAPVQIALLREATANRIPKDATALALLVKAVPIEVTAMMPIARAISTAGGIALEEIDESFMLRRIPGTFVAGEMLDWEAPTGGYLLQAAFSTAVAAAAGALRWLRADDDPDDVAGNDDEPLVDLHHGTDMRSVRRAVTHRDQSST